MPYHRRSPSKNRWLPGWLSRQGTDVMAKKKAEQGPDKGKSFILPENWGVPPGRELR